MSVREGLLLELVAENGESFWGEAAPLPGFSRESLEEASRELARAVEDLALESPPRQRFAAVSASLASDYPSVEFAVTAALASLDDSDVLDPDRCVALCGLLSGEQEEILFDAARLRKGGYRAVKLKVGRRTVEEDAALVREVRGVLGGGVSLRLDANRAWPFEEAREFAGLVSGVELEFIEEPLQEPGRLRELSDATGLPIALDESLVEMTSEEAPGHDYARAFVLKPSVIGHSRTVSLSSVARDLGAKAIISSSYESGVGMLGLARLAASFGGGAAGLDTYRRFAEDVLSPPLDLAKPHLNLREVFGGGREVNREKLERIS